MEDDNKFEQETDKNEKSDIIATSESNAEAPDSVISETEEKGENAEETSRASEENGVTVEDTSKTSEEKSDIAEESDVASINEKIEETKEAEVIVVDKDSEEKDYAEISEENNPAEEISEEAESEDTGEAVVSEETNTTEDEKEAVEPEIEEETEDSNEAVEDADITEKEASDQGIEEVALDKESSEVKSEESDTEKKSEEVTVVEEVTSESKSEETTLVVEESSDQKTEEKVVAEVESSEEFSFRSIFNKDFLKSFFFDIFFLGLCVWFTFMLIQKWFSMREVIIQGTSQVHGSIESGEKTTIGNINILVMGIDSVEGTHRSDTIFVLGVNPSKKKIMMLSIPRDTKVDIEGKSRKINEILPRYGEPTLRMLLEDLLKIRISRRIEVGFESFIAVVDAIGGVDINIEKPMHYDDNWGNLHIHFNPGMNHLNGQDALRYVRFRKDAMADLGRIKRQQDFVKAVIKKLFSPAIIVKLPSIIETAFKYIKTDFTLQEIMTLAKGFDTFDVKFSTLSLPGEARYIDKISYFIPNLDETIAIGNNYFSDLAIIEIEKDCDLGKIIPKQGKTNRKNK